MVTRQTAVDNALRERILAEYREMPGLRLTVRQASRLWAVDRYECRPELEALVVAGWLRRDSSGQYGLATGTPVRQSAGRAREAA